jgi:hypothetical protein
MPHPSPETLVRFARGIATPGEGREVVIHLLRRCPICSAIISAMVGPLLDPDIYEPVFEKASARACSAPRRTASEC